jgi:hypothetical protein
MAAIAFLLVFVGLCVLAACFGADSRQVDTADRRRNWS